MVILHNTPVNRYDLVVNLLISFVQHFTTDYESIAKASTPPCFS